ncbi:MAG: DUF4124 domain-containing protein [Burkholderiaceae bacterium]
MKFPALHRSTICILTVTALLAASHASAHYVWLNDKGVKQYSDLPPPSSVPDSRILKYPGRSIAPPSDSIADTAQETATDGAGKAPEKTKQPLTIAEKNAEFQKRKMEQAEKDKKAAEQQQQAAEKAKNCERAQAYQRSLESGERLARADKNGERYYLSDQQRSQEIQENKRFLDTCK